MRAIHCNALVQMKRDKDESNSWKFASTNVNSQRNRCNGRDMAQMEREKKGNHESYKPNLTKNHPKQK